MYTSPPGLCAASGFFTSWFYMSQLVVVVLMTRAYQYVTIPQYKRPDVANFVSRYLMVFIYLPPAAFYVLLFIKPGVYGPIVSATGPFADTLFVTTKSKPARPR